MFSLWRRIQMAVLTVLLVALVTAVVYLYYFRAPPPMVARVADPPALLQEIQRLQDLVTVKYSYQKVIGLKEQKIPFGSESVLLMVQARVLAGIDLGALTAEQVQITPAGEVTIELPPAKVIAVFVDDQQTQVWDRSKTWWTPWVPLNPELEQKARQAALEVVQAEAVHAGILKEARQNAEITIRNFLSALGVSMVEFEESSRRGN